MNAPLKGCTVFVDVKLEDGSDISDSLAKKLSTAGARVLKRFKADGKLTHLIWQRGDLDRESRCEGSGNVHVVSPLWLDEAIKTSTRPCEKFFPADLSSLMAVTAITPLSSKRKRSVRSMDTLKDEASMLRGADDPAFSSSQMAEEIEQEYAASKRTIVPPGHWACPACTCHNDDWLHHCKACGARCQAVAPVSGSSGLPMRTYGGFERGGRKKRTSALSTDGGGEPGTNKLKPEQAAEPEQEPEQEEHEQKSSTTETERSHHHLEEAEAEANPMGAAEADCSDAIASGSQGQAIEKAQGEGELKDEGKLGKKDEGEQDENAKAEVGPKDMGELGANGAAPSSGSTSSSALLRKGVVRVAMSGLDEEAKDTVRGCVKTMSKRLGQKVRTQLVDSSKPSASFTHLVVPGESPARTLKVLFAMARGAAVVTPEWVCESLAAEKWLEVTNYEVQRFKSRREASGALLDKKVVHVSPSVKQPPRREVEQLVQALGGTLAQRQNSADLVIVPTANEGSVLHRKTMQVVTLCNAVEKGSFCEDV
ncbi:unnamed protein product [Chrysoparadoxa australica]